MTGPGRRPVARDAILARIRDAAAGGRAAVAIPREYRTVSSPDVDIVERFAERVADYRAIVHRADRRTLPSIVSSALASRGAQSVAVPAGLPLEWLAGAEVEHLVDDPPLSHGRLDAVDAVVTGCAVAIAETGTIVLDAGAGQGRRVLSLLPDRHVCIVRVDQIVGDVPEALGRLDPRRPLTWISGPSATSDIELDRVEGVHGPRNLDVVILM